MATQLSKAQATLVEERHNNEAKDVQIAILHKSLEEILHNVRTFGSFSPLQDCLKRYEPVSTPETRRAPPDSCLALLKPLGRIKLTANS